MLTPAERVAQQAKYDELQERIENSTDGATLSSLMDERDAVKAILDKDDLKRMSGGAE